MSSKFKALLSAIIIFSLPICSAQAAINFPHLITNGEGIVKVKPNQARFTAKVSILKPTASSAKQAVDEVVNKVINNMQVNDLSAKDYQSTNLELRAAYIYKKDKKAQLVGYRATREINVLVRNLSNLNHILDVTIAAGVTSISSINLERSDLYKLKQQARQLAISDAKLKAQQLAQGFSLKVAHPWEIQSLGSRDSYGLMQRMQAMPTKSSNMGYNDKDITIKETIKVIFQLKK